jgi:diadenosine tetraphosphate (Ap4A) HIT family hydrolase
VLIPMLDKLTEAEQQALWRLLQHVQDDAKRDGARDGARQPWRRF